MTLLRIAKIASYKIFEYLKTQQSKVIGEGYSNAELIGSIVAKNIKYQNDVITTTSIPIAGMRTIFPFALGHFGEKISVLDFGGGGGNHYTEAKIALPTKKFHWTILETPEMVEECKLKRNSENELSFIDNLCGLNGAEIDLIIANGSIQYVEEPLIKLQELLATEPRYIYITRTALSELGEVNFTQISNFRDNGPSIANESTDERKVSYKVNIVPRLLFEATIKNSHDIQLKIIEERGVFPSEGKKINMYGYFCKRRYPV